MIKTTRTAVIQAAEDLETARQLKKQAEQQESDAKAVLIAALDDKATDALEAGAYIVTRQHITSTRLDTKRLKLDKPEIVEEYTTASSYEKLAVTPK